MNTQAILIIATVALVTWLTRALPFAVFGMRSLPRIVVYLGRVLPPAIMAALVVYCLKGIDLLRAPHGLAELISVAVVAAVHLWRRNALLSIFIGTACYMALIRTLFPA
jgi:branched-subunit amino acid transport protein AzlD